MEQRTLTLPTDRILRYTVCTVRGPRRLALAMRAPSLSSATAPRISGLWRRAASAWASRLEGLEERAIERVAHLAQAALTRALLPFPTARLPTVAVCSMLTPCSWMSEMSGFACHQMQCTLSSFVSMPGYLAPNQTRWVLENLLKYYAGCKACQDPYSPGFLSTMKHDYRTIWSGDRIYYTTIYDINGIVIAQAVCALHAQRRRTMPRTASELRPFPPVTHLRLVAYTRVC